MIASFDGESAGTVVRVSVTTRVMEGDLERLARSMEMGSAFASLGFYTCHELHIHSYGRMGWTESKNIGRGRSGATDILLSVQAVSP